MTNEEVLKTILRGEPLLSADLLQTVSASATTIGPLLLELIKSIRLWHTEEAGRWAVLHAIRLASSLQVRNSIPVFIDAIFLATSTRHEDALEDLPVALARAGDAHHEREWNERKQRWEYCEADVFDHRRVEYTSDDEVDRADHEHGQEGPAQEPRLLLDDRIGRAAGAFATRRGRGFLRIHRIGPIRRLVAHFVFPHSFHASRTPR